MSATDFKRLNAVKKEQWSLPAVKVAVPMTAGMLSAYFFQDTAAVVFMLILIPAAVYFVVKRSGLSLCALSALFGIMTMFIWMRTVAAPIAEFAGQTVMIEVEITDKIPMRDGKYLYVARGEINGKTAIMGLTGSSQLTEKQRITAKTELSEPSGERTAFNLSNGILLDGKIRKYTHISYGNRTILRSIENIRERLFNELLSSSSGDARMLAQSMLLGMDSELSASLEDNMRVCGASHYTAVSGTHFAVLAAVLLEMMSENRRKAKSALSIAFAFGGILFFGPTKSVMRASVMFFIGGLAGFFRRKPDTLNSLCISIILITAFRPQNILDVGFAMSAAGVFGAGVVGPKLAERFTSMLPKQAEWLSVPIRVMTISTSAIICTAPISAGIFGGVSAIGAVVTVILVPLMTVAMTSMLLAGITGLYIFNIPVEWSMRIAGVIIRYFGKQRWLYINMDFKGSWVFTLACAVMITVAAFGGISLIKPMIRCAAVSAFFALIMSQTMVFTRNEVCCFENSATSASVIMRGRNAAVYITGSGSGLAESISQCFRERGIISVECVYAPEADYSGALAIRELSETASVKAIAANELVKKLLPELPVFDNI